MVNLLCAKTCVAPVKGETTPRLELCSANLLVKLLANVNSLPVSSLKCWSDSTCVHGWIASEETLPVYVHNRVRRTVSGLPMPTWAHVKGEEIPADCAFRVISVGSCHTLCGSTAHYGSSLPLVSCRPQPQSLQ